MRLSYSRFAGALAAAALLPLAFGSGFDIAAQAQGRRNIPSPQAEAAGGQNSVGGAENDAFPPAPPSAASGAQFPPSAAPAVNSINGANNAAVAGGAAAGSSAAVMNPAASAPPANPPAADGRAALWPSVANQAAKPAESNPQNPVGGAAQPAAAAQSQNPPLNNPAAAAAAQNAPAAAAPSQNANEQNQTIRRLQEQVDALQTKLDNLQYRQGGQNGAAANLPAANMPASAALPSSAAVLPPAETPSAEAEQNDDENYAVPQDMDADALYLLGQNFMAQKSYVKAALVWRDFGSRFGADKRAAEAAFARGECYDGRGLYGQAAEIYLNMQTRYKDSPLAAQALLKLARDMANLQDMQTACATLDRLASPNMQADAAAFAQGRHMAAELRCP